MFHLQIEGKKEFGNTDGNLPTDFELGKVRTVSYFDKNKQ